MESLWPRLEPLLSQVSNLLIGIGGHCTYKPEPVAAFVDFVVLDRKPGG